MTSANKTMNSTPIAGAEWMTKKAMNEVLRKAARSLGLANARGRARRPARGPH
jgi:hypothetical protein